MRKMTQVAWLSHYRWNEQEYHHPDFDGDLYVPEKDKPEAGDISSDPDETDDFDCTDDEDEVRLVSDLGLSPTTKKVLIDAEIVFAEELEKMTVADLMNIKGITPQSVKEISSVLKPDTEETTAEEDGGESGMEMLKALIGLDDVKKKIQEIISYVKMTKDLPSGTKVPLSLHMQFTGNPGTCKTTVARILAKLFHEIGILRDGRILEVSRADLVGCYLGHTAEKTKQVFKKASASGQLIFIDEAYSLLDDRSNEFGDEAINTIVEELENNHDIIVVFAGYPDKMEELFDRNAGLKSRVPIKIAFKDYGVDELVRIAELEAKKRGFTISNEARSVIKGLYKDALTDPKAGNGRFARSSVESAILSYSLRVYGTDDKPEIKDFILKKRRFSGGRDMPGCQRD